MRNGFDVRNRVGMTESGKMALARIDDARDYLITLDDEAKAAQRDYERCYADIRLFGEALGHENYARPVSASVVMREYIAEVAKLTGRTVHFPSWDEERS